MGDFSSKPLVFDEESSYELIAITVYESKETVAEPLQ